MEKIKILIVEDEITVASSLKGLLENRDYIVTDIATTGDDAISSVTRNRPDLILMDIRLIGDKDGIETARHIYKQFYIPFIYLTAHSDEATINRAAQTASYGYILKPYSSDTIYASIGMALNKHQLEKKVQENEIKYRALFETMVNGYSLNEILYDSDEKPVDFKVLEINTSLRMILGEPEKINIKTMNEFFPNAQIAWMNIFSKVTGGAEPEKIEVYSQPLGKWFSIIVFSSLKECFSIITVDITEMKSIEREIQKRNMELQNLTAHMEAIREGERTKIAREIHDYLGQALTALRIDLSWTSKKLDANQKPILEKVKSMMNIIEDTLQNVRNICSELRPGILDHLGLTAAIDWQSREASKRTGIIFKNNYQPSEINIKDNIAVTFFRIYQEILTNIIRHSKATEVNVSLFKTDDEMTLSVKDNGKGITQEKINAPGAFGIMGMRERAKFLGGALFIESGEEPGTEVTLKIPLKIPEGDV